ncbi:MAG: aminotransferase class V-fold PLP-dependent enzyme [Bryobacteraceae bacterium]|nr:aminotransferase class V-fold PLP-dependent enzyme [Bryobacteraceae bacterium]MDW8379204.1 aminotransferase class V-fold PLP-dependent enzyme [Bryobacterales bacterium]
MSIYDSFGVRTLINAKGPSTRLSGGFLDPEVLAAMSDAAQYCVDMAELQAAASREIAQVTGAEAGLVTAGAAAGLLLGTAACIAGLDPAKMGRLPDTRGMKNEVIMVRSQRNFYDHAIRGAGAQIVEVGLPDRFAGAGVRDAETWEIDAAITERTAAVVYVAGGAAQPPLQEVAGVARAKNVPVLVDAAAQLPPASNLRRFLAEGADLVAFSGGKAIGGPQASGILAGKRDLIMSAALQQLDLDVYWEQWAPPASLIDKQRLPGLPQHGIGRPCKVGKETIIGLLVALRKFVAEPEEKRSQRLGNFIARLHAALEGVAHAQLHVTGGLVPKLELHLSPEAPLKALELCLQLEQGNPSVHADASRVRSGVIVFHPWCLKEADPERIAARVKQLLLSSDR